MDSSSILPKVDCLKPTVYVLRCRDGSLYTGYTTDLARRLRAHERSSASKYTRSRLPVKLVAWWHPQTVNLARSHEARFKRLPRAAKLAMLSARAAYDCEVYVTAPPVSP